MPRKKKKEIDMRTQSQIIQAAREKNAFIQGYACAVATLLRLEGCTNSQTDELFGAGIGNIETAKRARVDPSDLEVLEKHYPFNTVFF